MKTGHYLILLISYRFNVSTRVNRLGRHDFGHPYLHLIDRLQDRYQELFNILIYPRHRNLSRFKPVDGFVAIGVGPLSLDPEYVQQGEPLPVLKGDLHFMAERMKLECPPLPLAHKDEFKIFRHFIARNPKVTRSTLHNLAKEFKAKSNGQTVFPKLPCMLKVYCIKWKQNELIRQLKKKVRRPLNFALDLLDRPREAPPVVVDRTVQNVVYGSTPATLFVAPLVAPFQRAYIAMPQPQLDDGTQRRRRKCYYEPDCDKFADECGGFVEGYCRLVKSGVVTIGENFKQRSEEARKRRRSIQRAELREAQKRKRQQPEHEII